MVMRLFFIDMKKYFTSANYKGLLMVVIAAILISAAILSPDIIFLAHAKASDLVLNFTLVILVLLIPIILFHNRLKIYYVLVSLMVSLTPFLLLPALLIQHKMDYSMLHLALQSNMTEILELLSWKIVGLLICAVLLFQLCYHLLVKAFPASIPLNRALLMTLTALFTFSVVPFLLAGKGVGYSNAFRRDFIKYYPFRLALGAHRIYLEQEAYKNYTVNTARFNFGAYRKTKSPVRNIHVLIIGETARYDHWTINGYSRNTSPGLMQQKNIVSFSNVATAATITTNSVPLMITRVGVENFSRHMSEKGILAALNEAGYYTAWISNQDPTSRNETPAYHTYDADTTIFVNQLSTGELKDARNGYYDEALLEVFQHLIRIKGGDLYIVLHTMGSHWNYNARYPKQFDYFHPSSHTENDFKESLIDAYDNSIRYTDHFICGVIDILKQSNASCSMIYLSDHGENLLDDERKLMYHSPEPDIYTAKVPLFIWLSDSFIALHDGFEKTLSANRNRPVSSSPAVFYTILDLCDTGIGLDSNAKFNSLASPDYRNSRQEILKSDNSVCFFKNLK